MSNAVRKSWPLPITSGGTYTANGGFMVDLSTIPPINSQPGGVTYLTKLHHRVDLVIGNASGGAVVPGDAHVFDVIEQLRIQVPGRPPLWDLPTRAGGNLYRLIRAISGKRPMQANNGGSLSVNNSATIAIRLHLPVKFEFPRAINPGDAWIPLSSLKEGSQILGSWANGAATGWGPTGVTIDSATLTITAELIELPELRVPAWLEVKQIDQPSLDSDVFGVAGRVLHHLVEIPTQAGNQVADTVISDANRDLVDFMVDGRFMVERVDARELTAEWDQEWATDVAEYFEMEGGAATFVSILRPPNNHAQGGYKVTQVPLPRGNPHLRLTGTLTTCRLIAFMSHLNTSRAILDSLRDSQVPLPSGLSAETLDSYMGAKTASKGDAPKGSMGASRLPAKLYPNG